MVSSNMRKRDTVTTNSATREGYGSQEVGRGKVSNHSLFSKDIMSFMSALLKLSWSSSPEYKISKAGLTKADLREGDL